MGCDSYGILHAFDPKLHESPTAGMLRTGDCSRNADSVSKSRTHVIPEPANPKSGTLEPKSQTPNLIPEPCGKVFNRNEPQCQASRDPKSMCRQGVLPKQMLLKALA